MSADSDIFFSVIVPTYNRLDKLKKCLDYLTPKKQYRGRSINDNCKNFFTYEVIVSDDGDHLKTLKLVKDNYKWVKLLKGPQRGPAANRNNGAKNANGKWLVFTDDDCIPDSKWLYKYYRAITTDSKTNAMEGSIHPIGNINVELGKCPINLNGGCFWSANIAICRNLFEKINGFDENYQIAANEDQDIFIRIKKITHVKFIKESVVYHPVIVQSITKIIFNLPQRNKSWAYHCSKHHDLLNIKNRTVPIFRSIKNQMKYLIIHCTDRDYKDLLCLIIGFPINLICLSYYLYKFKFKKKLYTD